MFKITCVLLYAVVFVSSQQLFGTQLTNNLPIRSQQNLNNDNIQNRTPRLNTGSQLGLLANNGPTIANQRLNNFNGNEGLGSFNQGLILTEGERQRLLQVLNLRGSQPRQLNRGQLELGPGQRRAQDAVTSVGEVVDVPAIVANVPPETVLGFVRFFRNFALNRIERPGLFDLFREIGGTEGIRNLARAFRAGNVNSTRTFQSSSLQDLLPLQQQQRLQQQRQQQQIQQQQQQIPQQQQTQQLQQRQQQQLTQQQQLHLIQQLQPLPQQSRVFTQSQNIGQQQVLTMRQQQLLRLLIQQQQQQLLQQLQQLQKQQIGQQQIQPQQIGLQHIQPQIGLQQIQPQQKGLLGLFQ